jgi:hypothetical protein
MKQMLAYIAERAQLLQANVFFSRLRPDPDLRKVLAFAPYGTFWVMTFQDIIALNAGLAKEPKIKALVAQHLAEDTGHEQWFLEDLERVFGREPVSIRWLFAAPNRRVRAVSFALAAEVFGVAHDVLRLVLIEVLEAAAGVYFERISAVVRASDNEDRLKYFAGVHLAAEASHELHQTSGSSEVESWVIPAELRPVAEQLATRMFAAFSELGDALCEAMDVGGILGAADLAATAPLGSLGKG